VNTQLIVLGAPGSGKGTQALKLADLMGFKHVSTGDLLRAEVKAETELGKRVSSILSAGSLVSDEIVLELLKKNCQVDKYSYIFDGFPRNKVQAKMLEDHLLKGRNTLAVYFKIDLNILQQRIVNRRSCPSCGEIFNLHSKKPLKNDTCDKCGTQGLVHRKDDTESVVKNRLDVYQQNTEPLISFYREMGILKEIDASKSETEVFDSLKLLIN
jgi:adenylate kinase